MLNSLLFLVHRYDFDGDGFISAEDVRFILGHIPFFTREEMTIAQSMTTLENKGTSNSQEKLKAINQRRNPRRNFSVKSADNANPNT